jgi:hypothetical protein
VAAEQETDDDPEYRKNRFTDMRKCMHLFGPFLSEQDGSHGWQNAAGKREYGLACGSGRGCGHFRWSRTDRYELCPDLPDRATRQPELALNGQRCGHDRDISRRHPAGANPRITAGVNYSAGGGSGNRAEHRPGPARTRFPLAGPPLTAS